MMEAKKSNELQNVIQRFCESNCRKVRLDSLRKILDLIDFEESPSSSQCLAECNRGLLILDSFLVFLTVRST